MHKSLQDLSLDPLSVGEGQGSFADSPPGGGSAESSRQVRGSLDPPETYEMLQPVLRERNLGQKRPWREN